MINSKEAGEIMKIFKNVTDYESKGKFKEAIMEIQKAIKINPRDGNIFNRLGDLYVRYNRQPDAIESYRKGIDAYREDNFYRNALALCKKVLKYDPGNNDIYPIIAKLLVDLDEKSDALIYLFEYIERQKKNNNTKEVLSTCDYIQALNIKDPKIIERLNDIYRELGRADAVVKIPESPRREIPTASNIPEVDLPEIKHEPDIKFKESSPSRHESSTIQNEIVELDREENKLKEDLSILDESVRTIQHTVTEMRKAIRIDEVVIALDKSILTLTEQQKKSILNFQQSLSLNLDTLQKSVKEMHQGVDKSGKNLEQLFSNLTGALASLSKNQAFLAQEITKGLSKVGDSFSTATTHGINEVKGILTTYQESTQNMCDKMEESKDCNLNLLKSFNEMRTSVQMINDSLVKFVLAQESGAKKQRRFFTIIIALLGFFCGLFILSLFIK
jgi:tetratricopeptide (TPR) repeat protein